MRGVMCFLKSLQKLSKLKSAQVIQKWIEEPGNGCLGEKPVLWSHIHKTKFPLLVQAPKISTCKTKSKVGIYYDGCHW